MSYNLIVEDSLKYIDGNDRFKLMHEAVKLAKSSSREINNKHKPVIWAIKTLAEGYTNVTETSLTHEV